MKKRAYVLRRGVLPTLRLEFQRFTDVGEEDTIREANVDQFSLGFLYRL